MLQGKGSHFCYPKQVGNLAGTDKPETSADQQVTTPESNKKDIFVSYCWTNSSLSKENNEIKDLVGSQWNDPRKIKSLLSDKYNGRYFQISV